MTFEIGRKIRAGADEETGVETYSLLWGRDRASVAWVGIQVLAAICAGLASLSSGYFALTAIAATALLLGAALTALRFLRMPVAGAGKRIETYAAVWTLGVYTVLGIVPPLVQVTHRDLTRVPAGDLLEPANFGTSRSPRQLQLGRAQLPGTLGFRDRSGYEQVPGRSRRAYPPRTFRVQAWLYGSIWIVISMVLVCPRVCTHGCTQQMWTGDDLAPGIRASGSRCRRRQECRSPARRR